MKLFLKFLYSILLFSLSLGFPTVSSAATFRSGENVTVTERLEDLYATGGSVEITSPVINDLVVAGGNVRVTEDVSNSLIAAGGNVTLTGNVGNTIRVAGGNIIIEGQINNDVVAAGGTITIAENAEINGDLVIAGGTLRINGPVRGNVWISGGEAVINSSIGGHVWGGDVEKLTLGPRAAITGDLNYTSDKKAQVENGAVVRGNHNFKQDEGAKDQHADEDEALGILTGGTIYKLIIEILSALILLTLLPRLFKNTVFQAAASPLKSGFWGLGILVLTPILSVFLLLLVWLGIGAFLSYFLLLLLAMTFANVFVGWFILRWWYGRNDTEYILDWKAALLGPLVTTILMFIPVIGWILSAIIYLIALGALVLQIVDWVQVNRDEANKKRSTVTPVHETSSITQRSTKAKK